MFKRFAKDARDSVTYAVEVSKSLGQPVTVEQLLVGMYRSGGIGARVLASYGVTEDELLRAAAGGPARQAGLTDAEVAALRTVGIDADDIVRRAHQAFGPVQPEPSRRARFDPDTKHVLEQALRESLRMRHKHLGTEHLLLATLAARPATVGHGATYDDARQRVLDELRRAS